MEIRNKYSSLDMVRMAKFAKDNPELKPIPLIKAYNEKYPEVTTKQKLANIGNWIGTELCDKIEDLNECEILPRKLEFPLSTGNEIWQMAREMNSNEFNNYYHKLLKKVKL